MPGWKAPSPLRHDPTDDDGRPGSGARRGHLRVRVGWRSNHRLRRVVPAVALFALATAGCGPDGPDAPGALIPDVNGDETEEDLVQPGDAVLLIANEFSFAPADLVVEEGAYSGELVNEGKVAHNITFDGGESFDVAAGETVLIDFEATEGGVKFFCDIPGHAEAGMTGEVRTD